MGKLRPGPPQSPAFCLLSLRLFSAPQGGHPDSPKFTVARASGWRGRTVSWKEPGQPARTAGAEERVHASATGRARAWQGHLQGGHAAGGPAGRKHGWVSGSQSKQRTRAGGCTPSSHPGTAPSASPSLLASCSSLSVSTPESSVTHPPCRAVPPISPETLSNAPSLLSQPRTLRSVPILSVRSQGLRNWEKQLRCGEWTGQGRVSITRAQPPASAPPACAHGLCP